MALFFREEYEMNKNSLILREAGLYCPCIMPRYGWRDFLLHPVRVLLIIFLLEMIFG